MGDDVFRTTFVLFCGVSGFLAQKNKLKIHHCSLSHLTSKFYSLRNQTCFQRPNSLIISGSDFFISCPRDNDLRQTLFNSLFCCSLKRSFFSEATTERFLWELKNLEGSGWGTRDHPGSYPKWGVRGGAWSDTLLPLLPFLGIPILNPNFLFGVFTYG